MPQIEVSQELRFEALISTARNECRELGIYRVKPTKKLALTPIQQAIRYEIARGREHWTLTD
jgi:hypothetical protein